MSEKKVHRWVEIFKEGRTSVVDEHRSGRSFTAIVEANIACVDALISENRWISMDTIATMESLFQMGNETVEK